MQGVGDFPLYNQTLKSILNSSHYAVPLKLGVVLPLPLSPSPKKGGGTVHKRCASNER
jgi:hypothetical protein